MIETIELVDHGRGLQLSTSRITVMDLVQYFRKGLSYEEIRFGIPSLSNDEIAVVEEYYRANQAKLDAADDLVNARQDEAIRKQRERFPVIEETAEAARARFRERLAEMRHDGVRPNGDLAPINSMCAPNFPEDDELLERALAEADREAKDYVRREMGLL